MAETVAVFRQQRQPASVQGLVTDWRYLFVIDGAKAVRAGASCAPDERVEWIEQKLSAV